MLPSSVIKKDKKKLKGTESSYKGEKLKGIDELEINPMEKTISAEKGDFEVTKKIKPSAVNKTISPVKEDIMSIDLMMKGAKKNKNNATSAPEAEDFGVEKDEKGMWKESGAAKEKYLRALGKFKKKK